MVGLAAAAALAPGAAPAAAQRLDLWIDATAAHARPPGGVPGAEAATYGMLGAQLRAETRGGKSFDLRAHGGRSAELDGGAWVEGAAQVWTGGRLARWHVSGRAELFGLRYSDPFGYTAYGATVQPQAVLPIGGLGLVARGELTRGAWRAEQGAASSPLVTPPDAETGGLAVTGGALEAVYAAGRATARFGVEAYRSRADGAFDGGYRGIGAAVGFAAERVDALIGAQVWRTPAGDEVGYRAGAAVAIRPDLLLRVHLGRTVRDPLYGAPGSLVASLGVSWRVGALEPARPPRIVEIGARESGGRRVRFRLRAPAAESVALAGDFTGWDPRPMRREDEATWFLDVVLEPGLHHFAFLVDGERWTVPEDAPGVADDGWGRKNASIVVER